jgi:ribonuclease P protein component
LIGRIHERRTFDRLRRDGRRLATAHLWCRYLADGSVAPPRVGFAIGRSVGPAVARNRVRRRLRALLVEHVSTGRLRSGWLLVGVAPDARELTYDALRSELAELVRRIEDAAVAP